MYPATLVSGSELPVYAQNPRRYDVTSSTCDFDDFLLMPLRNSAAIVTGGSGGIGKEVARQLSALGQPVVIYDVAKEQGEAIVESIKASGGEALFFQGDVGSEDDWQSAIETTIKTFGGLRTLVHNAGIAGPTDLPSGTLEQWNQVISINQTSIFLGCKYAEAALTESAKQGEVASCVIISSVLGSSGSWGYAPGYHATKGAATNITRCLAVSWAPLGIRVNAVCPGYIETPLTQDLDRAPLLAATPMRRLGRPEEVANAVTWLTSSSASYVTGSNLFVDGGFSISK